MNDFPGGGEFNPFMGSGPLDNQPSEQVILRRGESWAEPSEPREAQDGGQESGGEAGNGGYDPLAAAHEDHAAIREAVRVITRVLSDLSETLRHGTQSAEQLRLAEQVRAAAVQLLLIATAMLSKGVGQAPDLVVPAMGTADVVNGETEAAWRKFAGAAWEKVREEVKRISRRLWSLIGHLVKVKEWTVQGTVGTSMLGLASASVSVTFGKP